MPPATLAIKNSQSKNTHSDARLDNRSTRLLLALWFLGGESINQGELTKRVKLKDEKSQDCQKFFIQLEGEGAIRVADKKISLTESGKSTLGHRLQSTDLGIEATIIGSWVAKALLKWIQQAELTTSAASTNGKVAAGEIASYDEFKPVALEAFDRLNRDYNSDNLVPIYRIRREIGNRVSRAQFDEWLLEMQTTDIFQLIGGEMPELTPDKAEDSVKTALGGVRYYVKHL